MDPAFPQGPKLKPFCGLYVRAEARTHQNRLKAVPFKTIGLIRASLERVQLR
jgi:hypothetical protein